MKIMVLGHKDHGKTTVAELLRNHFGFSFTDTTNKVLHITKKYLKDTGGTDDDVALFDLKYATDKDSVREVMKKALREYTKDDPARLIRDQFISCDIYAGCRSQTEFDAAKDLIDLTLWVKDDRKLENDSTMDIQFTEGMIELNNSGSIMQLERNIKGVLHELAGIDIRTYDKTLRHSIVSNMKSTQKHKISIPE